LCPTRKHLGRAADAVRKVIEFIKGKREALQKEMVVLSGLVSQVGSKQEAELRLSVSRHFKLHLNLNLKTFKHVGGERFGWSW
jgi:hypothetical protein